MSRPIGSRPTTDRNQPRPGKSSVQRPSLGTEVYDGAALNGTILIRSPKDLNTDVERAALAKADEGPMSQSDSNPRSMDDSEINYNGAYGPSDRNEQTEGNHQDHELNGFDLDSDLPLPPNLSPDLEPPDYDRHATNVPIDRPDQFTHDSVSDPSITVDPEFSDSVDLASSGQGYQAKQPSSSDSVSFETVPGGISSSTTSTHYRLEVLTRSNGEDYELCATIPPDGFNFGRSHVEQSLGDVNSLQYLAKSHLLFMPTNDGIIVEDLGSINGVYRKIDPGRPVELSDGARFRIGRHVIQVRKGSDQVNGRRVIAPDSKGQGEVFHCFSLTPLGYLDFIGPSNTPIAHVPITNPKGLVLGRQPQLCDLSLSKADDWVSRKHAIIRVNNGRFSIEDLESSNGTFVQLSRKVKNRLRVGTRSNQDADILLIGELHFRVMQR